VTVPLILTLACTPLEAQPGVRHILKISVLGPEMDPVIPPMEMPFAVTPGANPRPGWEVRTRIPLQVNFMVTTPGTYSIEIVADDASVSVPYSIEQPASE
jgi:hypothetical protein